LAELAERTQYRKGKSNMEQSLLNNRVCPTNPFIKFEKEEIEQSIPERFEKQVVMYPDRLAVKDQNSQLTYDQLNQTANRVAQAILEQKYGKRFCISMRLASTTTSSNWEGIR